MGKHAKYTRVQEQFLLDNLDTTNKELKGLFEDKFKVNIATTYIANFKYRLKTNKSKFSSFNKKIGDSYVNKDSRISEELSEEIKENVDLFREMAKRGVRK